MSLELGDTLGPYVIAGTLGKGGMGEVFKARDTRLNRFVAIKIVGLHGQQTAEARRRLRIEAEAIASLSHPHIAALYDTGHDRGLDYLVLEYLEGETLEDRLRRGRISFRESVGWGIELAEAMAYAHGRGVIHRDLKPANIFIDRANRVRLLDFGLAAMKNVSADAMASLSTEPVKLTAEGTVVGTLHYLAPERLQGAAADVRSDIFSYGAILYEMASGTPPYDGATQAQLIAAILTQEPTIIEGPPPEAAELWPVVRCCLSKRPEDRWESMADVAIVLRSIVSRSRPSAAQERAFEFRRAWWMLAGAATAGVLALVALATYALALRSVTTPAARPVSFSVMPPTDSVIGLTDSTIRSAQLAVAPDGHAVVFVARTEGADRLWIRPAAEIEPRLLEGTAGASYPFWSPDSRHIAFFADRQLKRVSADGGPVQPVCEATNGRGGTWSPDGEIVFVPNNTSPLHRVSAAGGSPVPLAPLPAGHSGHRWPQFLPDGHHVLFLAKADDQEVEGLYVTSLADPSTPRRLRASSSSGLYASGHLLHVLDGVLVAQPFHPETLELGPEISSLDLPVSASSTFYSAFSASTNEMLATWSGSASSDLVWFDRQGNPLATAAPRDRYVDFRLSPDDGRLAYARVNRDGNDADLWVLDLARGVPMKLTFAAQTDASPVWAPDGRRLAFRSNRGGLHDLFEHPLEGAGGERRLFRSGAGMYPTTWSASGDAIAYHERRAATGYDILVFDFLNRTARPLVATRFDDVQAQLGPGGRLAFTSNQSGEFEVYVSFRGDAAAAERISAAGGSDPRWRTDGSELFFIAGDGTLMVADTGGPVPRLGAVRPLFRTPLAVASSPYPSAMVPSADGQRFLIKVPVDLPEASPLTVMVNWTARLGARE